MLTSRTQFVQQPCDNNHSTQPSQFSQRITFRHPGYHDRNNQLFSLICTDFDGTNHGLYHGLAHTAAAIVAGNRFDGFLSPSRQGGEESKVTQEYHELLPPGDYYFHLPPCSTTPQDSRYQHDYSLPYPIFASFQDWIYPDEIPPAWTNCPQIPPPPNSRTLASSLWTEAVTKRDGCCRLTGADEYCEAAHLIPVKEAAWFNQQGMGRFAAVLRSPTIYDIGNLLLLRGDIHRLLDQLKWVIYPKAVSVGSALETRLVFHHLDAVPQLRMLYHNVPLRETAGLRVEYLLSRFALTIFEGVGPFLWYQVGRHLIKVSASAEGGRSEFFTGSDITRGYPPPGTRSRKSNSSSPTKRSRRESESPTRIAEMDSMSSGFNHKKRRRSSSDPVEDGAKPNPAKRTQGNIGLKDVPCSCTHQEEPLTPTSADGKSVDAEDPPWQPFKFCRARTCLARLEYERVGALRETALHAERAKSGTEDWWTGITAWWEQKLRRGGGISPQSIRKWKWIEGAEFEEGELDFLRDETTEPRWWL